MRDCRAVLAVSIMKDNEFVADGSTKKLDLSDLQFFSTSHIARYGAVVYVHNGVKR